MHDPSPLFASPPPEALLATAVLAARRAGLHALGSRDRRRDANSIARHDVKLKLDVECQQRATESLLACFPDHRVLGEEDDPAGAAAGAAGAACEWIVDPIDGTVNFFHGNPYWCCSVAVRRGGEVQAGCVYAPELDLLFEAALGGPALRNGRPIRVSDIDRLDRSNVHTGADKDAATSSEPFRFFNRIARLAQRPRICGAAALDICMVAAGAAEAFFEPGIFLWDIAAGDLVVRQAGGRGSVLRRRRGHHLAYLASNGLVHEALAAALEPLLEPAGPAA